jgi:hypothetical protein
MLNCMINVHANIPWCLICSWSPMLALSIGSCTTLSFTYMVYVMIELAPDFRICSFWWHSNSSCTCKWCQCTNNVCIQTCIGVCWHVCGHYLLGTNGSCTCMQCMCLISEPAEADSIILNLFVIILL